MTCLDDCKCANQIDLQNLPEFFDGLVHQHCMIGDAGIVDESCQRLSLQFPAHLHTISNEASASYNAPCCRH